MSVIAFIPARGGSKSIPNKNIKLFCGKPMIVFHPESKQDELFKDIDVSKFESHVKNSVPGYS